MANVYSANGLEAAMKYFNDALAKYGRSRQKVCEQTAQGPDHQRIEYVGQFIDPEGIKSTQHGIYGMSAWLTLTQSLIPETDPLRISCRDALKLWVERSGTKDVLARPDDNSYELRFVVPKICHAYRAMMATGCEDAGRTLLGYIMDASKDGSWGHLTSSTQSDACITALVVRTFGKAPSFSASSLPKSLRFLQRHHDESKNPCERLYVLNTLRLSDPHSRLLPDVDSNELIKKQIRGLLADIEKNPLSVSNPVTLHFADEQGHRLRYYRFPGDLIVLESLLLISGPHIRLYPHQLGRHIGNRLGKILDGADDLAVDTCNDRMSFPTCLYIKEVLNLLSEKVGKPQGWFMRSIGSIWSLFTFRREAKSHLIGFLIGLILLAVVSKLWEEVFRVVLGAVLVEVMYVGREALIAWGEHRSEEI